MCYFICQAQKITISCGFNLISKSSKIQDGGQNGPTHFAESKRNLRA